MEKLNYLITEHLKSNNIYTEDPPWIIKESNVGERGLFANRDIKVGEIIFKDNTIILGPRSSMLCPIVCVNCYAQANLYPCSQNCGLPICSKKCENSDLHNKECELLTRWKTVCFQSEINLPLLKCLTPIRSLLLTDNKKTLLKLLKSHSGAQHGFEVDILKEKLGLNFNEEQENLMRLTCTILDANSFEVTVGNEKGRTGVRGLFPLSSLMNHSCLPNTMHNFDKYHTMIVKATVAIAKGQELFHSYTRFTWGTPVRRMHLNRTKHFFCRCIRCEDPTESGTNLSGILCRKCHDLVLPVYSNETTVTWECIGCKEVMPNHKVAVILQVLGSRVNNFYESDADVEEMLKFLKEQLINYLPYTNQIAVELKYKLIWILGYNPKYLWSDLSDELLIEKRKYLSRIANTVGNIKSRPKQDARIDLIRIVLLFKRKNRRNPHSNDLQIYEECKVLFDEAKMILKDDVHAPQEIKDYYKSLSNGDENIANGHS